MRTKLLQIFGVGVALGVVSCVAGAPSDGSAPGGDAGDSGTGNGTAGASTAGSNSVAGTSGTFGGSAGTGNAASGGTLNGGSGGLGTSGFGAGGAGTGNGGSASGSAGASGAGDAGAGNGGSGAVGGGAGNAGTGSAGKGGTGASGFGAGGAGAVGGNAGNAGTGSAGKGGGGAGGGGAGGAGGTGSAGMSGGGAGGSGGTGGSGCIMGSQRSGGTQHCSNSQGNIAGGYSYQLWSNGVGSGCMTPYGTDATFKANWTSVGDFLARVGLGFNSSKTFDQLGTIASDFAYTKTGSGGGFSYIGIYGWSVSPLVEYYIVEDWYGNNGPPTGGGTKKGSFTLDDGTYNVYTHTQVNQPAITGGNQTFPQFFSVRQTPRQCGHISISEHFKQWASMGLTLGKMEEARILVEVGGGTGSIDFTTATVTAK